VDTTLIAHCRAGFETECTRDLERIACRAGGNFTARADGARAFVAGTCSALDRRRWHDAMVADPPIFARSIFIGSGPHALGERDRVTPIVALARSLHPPFRDVWLETPDTNDGKLLSGFCRRIDPLLTAALRSHQLLVAAEPVESRLHTMFTAMSEAYVGSSDARVDSPWPMGIPRVRMPGAAPSRSTLKLAEAFMTFLPAEEQTHLLRAGMRAVDLGAAPGGWTWQLATRGMRVTAVDNGPLKGDVANNPLVEHLRADGLSYRPRHAVDWMVCDIVDQPSKIARLVVRWLVEGSCRHTIFNLKLPMKKRYDEVQRCGELIRATLEQHRMRNTLRFKQLYHDREEVTGYATVV
jgi:23S rRNA (cytidine2498-2'-O)-methyltransferase